MGTEAKAVTEEEPIDLLTNSSERLGSGRNEPWHQYCNHRIMLVLLEGLGHCREEQRLFFMDH